MPESVCTEPRCPEFASKDRADRGRCTEHAKSYRRETKGRTVGVKFYSTKRWQVLRRKILARDRYTCQQCKRFGNNVDHKVSILYGGAVWQEDNLQTLCRSCHSSKTAREVWHGA